MVARLRWHLRSRLSLIHWQHNRTYVYNRVREARDREGWREGGFRVSMHKSESRHQPSDGSVSKACTMGGNTFRYRRGQDFFLLGPRPAGPLHRDVTRRRRYS